MQLTIYYRALSAVIVVPRYLVRSGGKRPQYKNARSKSSRVLYLVVVVRVPRLLVLELYPTFRDAAGAYKASKNEHSFI